MGDPDDVPSILFVCYGNLCRSPMAEAILRHRLRRSGREGRIKVDSAGTHAWAAGDPPHPDTLRVLSRNGVEAGTMRARKVTPADLQEFDQVIAMDQENLRFLNGLGPSRNPIELMMGFMPGPTWLDVPDPFIVGGFEEVYEMLDGACEGILSRWFPDGGPEPSA